MTLHSPRPRIALALAAVLLAASPLPALSQSAAAPAATAATASAGKVVLDNTRRVLTQLEARRDEFSRDRSALRSFITTEFDALFDRDYAARQVLGRHARGAAEDDIRLFGDALTDNLLQQYASSLLDFNSRLQVRIKSETPLPRNIGVRVSSELLRGDGTVIPVDYLMRRSGDRWRVFDVMVEGVSMVQTFRQQFDTELQRKSIRQVATELRNGRLKANTGD